ncbi:MAG: hypothetical protein HC879_16745 [Leptolyngbyaceae cyanobacterium SL_5_9]|nr:hypothetical protein [Leptolyngbyaceae cyanobacterium SL_5_9]
MPNALLRSKGIGEDSIITVRHIISKRSPNIDTAFRYNPSAQPAYCNGS